MPMLANVLLRTQGKNQLLVAATDLNVSLTAELKSHNAADGGLTLGAKNLYELIANAPGDEVTLKKADNHWAACTASASRRSTRSGNTAGMPARQRSRASAYSAAKARLRSSASIRAHQSVEQILG